MTWLKWSPDDQQWKVIWGVYGIAFFFSLNFFENGAPMDAGWFIFYVVVAGALVLWRMEQKKRDRAAKPKEPTRP